MAQPTFVPVPDADRVRPSIPAPVPLKARANRPGELRAPTAPSGPRVGTTGPDQGYALSLSARLVPRLHLGPGEHAPDVESGLALLACKRSALAGRAPCSYDLDVAAGLFGLLDQHPPAGLVALRREAFRGVAHDYEAQRALVDRVPDAALACSPAAARDASGWRERLGVEPPADEAPSNQPLAVEGEEPSP